MRWYTRKHAKVDRIACPWLILRFVDPQARFYFMPADTNWDVIKDGQVFDVPRAELGHVDGRCSFESILIKYELVDPALALLGKIIHNADCKDQYPDVPEGHGLKAVAEGMALICRDDHDNMAKSQAYYDALYAYCQKKVEKVEDRHTK